MSKKKFSEILKRFGHGKATEAEKILIEQWYKLLDDENAKLPSSAEFASIESRLWEKIQSQTSQSANTKTLETTSLRPVFVWGIRLAVAAAAIGIVYLIGVQFLPTKSQQFAFFKQTAAGLQTKENDSNYPLLVKLEDGSVITLAPKATITFPTHFSQERREVSLEGEAFFDISKNPNRPFYVYCNKLVTHVLGTSFTIKPIAGENEVEISVRTGRVEVFENEATYSEKNNKKSNGVVLLPNQKVIYNSGSGLFEPSIVDIPVPLIAIATTTEIPVSFIFEEVPLSRVLETLSKVYGIEIIAENESIYNCPFSGDITEQDLFAKLDIINKVLTTSYEIKGTKILLKGKGCE